MAWILREQRRLLCERFQTFLECRARREFCEGESTRAKFRASLLVRHGTAVQGAKYKMEARAWSVVPASTCSGEEGPPTRLAAPHNAQGSDEYAPGRGA